MSCSTIFEVSLEEETNYLFQQLNEDRLCKLFKRIIGRHKSETEELKKSVKFFQNNYTNHKQTIQNLKCEIKRLNGILEDREVPDIDYRPRNPSPPPFTDSE